PGAGSRDLAAEVRAARRPATPRNGDPGRSRAGGEVRQEEARRDPQGTRRGAGQGHHPGDSDAPGVGGRMMNIQLRDYQEESIERLRHNIRRGVMTQVLCAPTGSGKTVCAAYLLHECYEKGKRALFIADRVALIDQTSATLDQYGIPHGVIQADHWR